MSTLNETPHGLYPAYSLTFSISEFSLLDSTLRFNSSGKKSGDRDALRVAMRVRPLNEGKQDSRIATYEGENGELRVVNRKKLKVSAHLMMDPYRRLNCTTALLTRVTETLRFVTVYDLCMLPVVLFMLS